MIESTSIEIINKNSNNGRLQHKSSYSDKNTANFLDAMFSHSCLSFINTPTRVTGHSKT